MNLNKKQKLLDSGIEIVAELGLEDFSMAKVAARADASERLIYQHFKTKKNFLFSCYEEILRKLEAVYEKEPIEEVDIFGLDNEQRKEVVKKNWLRYFGFLVGNSSDTLFYDEYRRSAYVEVLPISEEEMNRRFFKPFLECLSDGGEFSLEKEMFDVSVALIYIVDGTMDFARRFINGDIEDTEENYERIFDLMYSGVSGVLENYRQRFTIRRSTSEKE